MTTITLASIRAILGNDTIRFIKKGRGGKVAHLSDIHQTNNHLLCGVAYSRSGTRNDSSLFPLYINESATDVMCKNCLKIVQDAVQPVGAVA
jgi:hypothetical protein